MLPYWLLFTLIAFGAAIQGPPAGRQKSSSLFLVYAGVLIALMIGFRYHVGGDWWTYQRYFQFAKFATLGQLLRLDDPGYQFLNWLAQRLGGGVWIVNLICGFLFSWGLVRFARTQPYPWLCLVLAVPYLVIVVAMGYSRQGLAIGILMAGLASFQRHGSILRYTFYVATAALFHRTAIIGLPFVLLGGQRNLLSNMLFVIAGTALLYDIFLSNSIDHFIDAYMNTRYSSQGAAIRVTMSVIPAAIFFLYRRRLGFSVTEAAIWRNFSFAAIAVLAGLFLTSSSTVVDRLALYILPLQLAVLPRIPGTLVSVRLGKLLIIAYALAIQFVWLNYAAFSPLWIPYRLNPFSD